MAMQIYRNSQGKKLYPVCVWEKNQHKLYNAYDRAYLALYDEGYTDEAAAELERVEKAMSAFDAHVIGGMVYATWEDGKVIKDIIGAYNVRKDMAGCWKEY